MCPVRELALCADVNSAGECSLSFFLSLLLFSPSVSCHIGRLGPIARVSDILYTDNTKKCARTVSGAEKRARAGRAKRKHREVRRERDSEDRAGQRGRGTFEVVRE